MHHRSATLYQIYDLTYSVALLLKRERDRTLHILNHTGDLPGAQEAKRAAKDAAKAKAAGKQYLALTRCAPLPRSRVCAA